MSKPPLNRGIAMDGHRPVAIKPGLGREQAGHQPTTNQLPPGPPPNQGSGGKK